MSTRCYIGESYAGSNPLSLLTTFRLRVGVFTPLHDVMVGAPGKVVGV
ncbi:MAG: hypothetical protein ACO2OZ_02200 [Acidilobaceae archaeon]